MRVLAGDIGGTHTRLQVMVVAPDGLRTLWAQCFDSREFTDFTPLLTEFLDNAQRHSPGEIEAACLGVAGPVQDHQARVTNLPWIIDAGELSKRFGLPDVTLINDFQAVGYGIAGLPPEDIVVLQPGQAQPHAPRALIGAGTGLGEGLMVWQDSHYEILPSEGGHVDFAPVDPLQRELLCYLADRMERVTYERIVSGPGLVRIYEFLCETGSVRPTHELSQALVQAPDKAACISDYALQGCDPVANQALELFVAIYGAQAGNLALTLLARGGVYIAGGIAPKIIDKLRDGSFIRAFNAKPPMADLLAAMPVMVVMNDQVGLIGAALKAAREGAASDI